MALQFDQNWLSWDVDVREVGKLEAKEVAGTLTVGGRNTLSGLRELRKKRAEGAIFLTFFNQRNVAAAICRALPRFKSSTDANQMLADSIEVKQKVTIKQGTHQAEGVTTGGYRLHFDAHSGRNGKCFRLQVLPSVCRAVAERCGNDYQHCLSAEQDLDHRGHGRHGRDLARRRVARLYRSGSGARPQ